jgi:uncharacterized membrane protein
MAEGKPGRWDGPAIIGVTSESLVEHRYRRGPVRTSIGVYSLVVVMVVIWIALLLQLVIGLFFAAKNHAESATVERVTIGRQSGMTVRMRGGEVVEDVSLPRQVPRAGDRLTVRVERDDDGTVIDVRPDDWAKPKPLWLVYLIPLLFLVLSLFRLGDLRSARRRKLPRTGGL